MCSLKIRSLDNQIFEVDLQFAKSCLSIKSILDYLEMREGEDYEIIPLKIDADVLEAIVEWAEFHRKNLPLGDNHENVEKHKAAVNSWNEEFFRKHHKLLFKLIEGVNFLKHEKLIQLSCDEAEKHVYRKSAAQIRSLFNLIEDFTDDEKRQIKRNQKLYNRRKAMKSHLFGKYIFL